MSDLLAVNFINGRLLEGEAHLHEFLVKGDFTMCLINQVYRLIFIRDGHHFNILAGCPY